MLTTNSHKRILWILVSGFIVFIIFCAALLVGGIWLEKRLVLVRRGEAKPNFPFESYKEEELRVLMPFAFEDALYKVPTRTPPEVTLQRFLDAMKKGDIDTAADQFVEKDRGKWEEFLLGVKQKGMVDEMLKDLKTAEEISKDSVYAQFDYTIFDKGEKYAGSINFAKNTQGDWKIKNL